MSIFGDMKRRGLSCWLDDLILYFVLGKEGEYEWFREKKKSAFLNGNKSFDFNGYGYVNTFIMYVGVIRTECKIQVEHLGKVSGVFVRNK